MPDLKPENLPSAMEALGQVRAPGLIQEKQPDARPMRTKLGTEIKHRWNDYTQDVATTTETVDLFKGENKVGTQEITRNVGQQSVVIIERVLDAHGDEFRKKVTIREKGQQKGKDGQFLSFTLYERGQKIREIRRSSGRDHDEFQVLESVQKDGKNVEVVETHLYDGTRYSRAESMPIKIAGSDRWSTVDINYYDRKTGTQVEQTVHTDFTYDPSGNTLVIDSEDVDFKEKKREKSHTIYEYLESGAQIITKEETSYVSLEEAIPSLRVVTTDILNQNGKVAETIIQGFASKYDNNNVLHESPGPVIRTRNDWGDTPDRLLCETTFQDGDVTSETTYHYNDSTIFASRKSRYFPAIYKVDEFRRRKGTDPQKPDVGKGEDIDWIWTGRIDLAEESLAPPPVATPPQTPTIPPLRTQAPTVAP